jgi:tetratricopeptide (TPR) repeat protein
VFKEVPVQVWLLISFAAVGFGPARYLFRYNAHSPSRRDITKPPEDLSWRTPEKLYASLAIVGGLAALSVFIFTPTAADFAQSPTFWPLLSAGIGAWALVSVARGFAAGKIMPFVRGATQTYERETQPKRFWASLSWNAVLGSLMLGMSGFILVGMPMQTLSDRCYNGKETYTAQKVLAACNELIAKHRGDQEMASWLAWRGSAYYDLKDFKRARDDYDAAVRLDPKDAASYYNLGLLDERDGNVAEAVDHYTRSIRVRPGDADTLVRRGNAFLDTGRFPEGLSDFSRAHELNPKDMTSIADRGLTYVWMKDLASAERDFAMVRTTDPANAIVLRGEALMSVGAGDLRGAVDKLTASLKSEPDNRWALRMRAEMYSRLGEEEKSLDDKDALWRLSKVSSNARQSS